MRPSRPSILASNFSVRPYCTSQHCTIWFCPLLQVWRQSGAEERGRRSSQGGRQVRDRRERGPERGESFVRREDGTLRLQWVFVIKLNTVSLPWQLVRTICMHLIWTNLCSCSQCSKHFLKRGPDGDTWTKLCSPECRWCLFGALVIHTCIFSSL